MTRSHRCRAVAGLLAATFALGPAPGLAAAWSGASPRPLPSAADADARIVHALNRLAFGPRPGDVERIRALGLERWIEEQLQPERIRDAELASRLAAYPTVGLPSHTLLAKYQVPPDARRRLQSEIAAREQGGMPVPDAQSEEGRRQRRELLEEMGVRLDGSPRQVVTELQAAKIARAVHSERQLEEVLVDFWLNHFNVDANKGPVKFLVAEYEREVIRPNAFGRFEDLLLATARHPAMLFYLDNWLSSDPEAAKRAGERSSRYAARGGSRGRGMPPGAAEALARRSGLNENYARELMELHTLGVDGGYDQRDVTELARCLTGWSIQGLRDDQPRFRFAERLHARGGKRVLGHAIEDGGLREGEQAIHLLATHPATARFVSAKLARRLVADEPPPALVARAAETFRRSDGRIRDVVRTIVESPEFWQARGEKLKTPFEFVVSALRATGADVRDAREAARRVAEMGMPLYQQQPPTGYKDTAEAWVSTSGLLSRLNFALDLAGGRLRGARAEPSLLEAEGDAAAVAAALAAAFVPTGLTSSTSRTIEQEAQAGLDSQRIAGLILGSPEFQRR